MSDFLTLRVELFAGEMLAASALILTVAWLASFRKSASARHLVWTAAFGALLLLPVLAALFPGRIVWTVPAPSVATVSTVSADFTPAAYVPLPAPQPDQFAFDNTAIVSGLIALWLAGIGLIALRGLIAAVVLHLMRRDSTDNPFDPSELPELSSGRAYDLRVSNAERGPVMWGIFRPTILLPNKSLFWPGERLHAVLRHELAHIHRHDGLTQLLSLAACALYWPNPFVWLAARALRREAEMAADDAVIVSGMTPSDYAGELLQVAAEFRTRGLSAAAPLYMAAPSSLEARVQSVLSPLQQRSGVTSMDILKIAGAALLATTALVAARPSLAQDAPPAPPSVVAAPATPDVPPAPATPSDLPALPAPPAPEALAAPPALPALPAPPASVIVTDDGKDGVRIVRIRKFRDPKTHELRVTRTEIVRARADAQRAIAAVQPEIERAMAQVRQSRIEIREAQPEIDAQIGAARPEIEKALAEARTALTRVSDAKIRAQVDRALDRAQAKLDAAQSRMNESHEEDRVEDTDAPDTPDAPDAPDGK
jgi:beta-lactamase regulating signal transducer with metallopeptidase domain